MALLLFARPIRDQAATGAPRLRSNPDIGAFRQLSLIYKLRLAVEILLFLFAYWLIFFDPPRHTKLRALVTPDCTLQEGMRSPEHTRFVARLKNRIH
jgi:hypothetical protein